VISSLFELPAFCINLDTRPDRWAQAQNEFSRIGLRVSRWPGATYAQSPSPVVSKEHAGCLDSHRQLWQHCLNAKLDVMAVFEDDVVLASDFIDIFDRAWRDLPADWGVWHLHSSHAKTLPHSEYLVRIVSAMWGGHGYLIRPVACKQLLALPGYDTVDRRLSRGYLKIGGRPFGSAPAFSLCFQRGDDSNIPSTAQLDFWKEQRATLWR
jgi:hypothetical protein